MLVKDEPQVLTQVNRVTFLLHSYGLMSTLWRRRHPIKTGIQRSEIKSDRDCSHIALTMPTASDTNAQATLLETHPYAHANYKRVDLERSERSAVRRRACAHPDLLDVSVDKQIAGDLHVDTRLQGRPDA